MAMTTQQRDPGGLFKSISLNKLQVDHQETRWGLIFSLKWLIGIRNSDNERDTPRTANSKKSKSDLVLITVILLLQALRVCKQCPWSLV